MFTRLLIRLRWLLTATTVLLFIAVGACGIAEWSVRIWNIAVLFEHGGVLFWWGPESGPVECKFDFAEPYDSTHDLTGRFGMVSAIEYGVDAFVIPVWAFAVATAVVTALSWILSWRSSMRRVGTCPRCDYLVGAAKVCPECGCASQIAPLLRAPWKIRTLMWWRWVTLTLTVLIIAVSVATNWIYVRVRFPSLQRTTPVAILSDGGLELDWWLQVLDKDIVEWEWGRRPQWQGWVWWFRRHSTRYWFGVTMPLWLIAIPPAAASAGGFWARHRRRRPDGCGACGRLRGGLEPCPRCGFAEARV